MNKDIKDKLFFLIPIGLVLIAVGVFYFGQDAVSKNNLSADELAEKAINYLNNNILPAGTTASLIDISEEGDVYKIRVEVEGTEYQSYVSKDGKYLFPDAFVLDTEVKDQEQPQELSKREVPDVKLFVMSYCSGGLQAQKMYLPVYDLLADKVDMGVYFVNYIMHEKIEIDENLTQYCIQKEQTEKYNEYLSCFVKDGDSENCLLSAEINKAQLDSCVNNTDEQFSIYSQYQDRSTWLNGNFPKFDVHDDLNQQYGVGGSPTIVINDQVLSFLRTRSPEAFKQAICGAFTSAPEECSQVLSDTAFSSGFGLEAGTSNSQSCDQ